MIFYETKSVSIRDTVLNQVDNERLKQDAMWGKQRHDRGTWLAILMEEVGEVAQAMQVNQSWGKKSDAGDLYSELVQVAAVAVAIAEQVAEDEQ